MNYTKLFKKLASTKGGVKYEEDKISKQKYLIFEDVLALLECKEELQALLTPTTQTAVLRDVSVYNFETGKLEDEYRTGEYHDTVVTIKPASNYLIIVKDADHAFVRNVVLGDTKNYKYTITFKNAEYHGYCELHNTLNGKSIYIGTSVYPFAKEFGSKILREEDAYDNVKYYKGNMLIEGHAINPKNDRSSFGIEMFITEEQLKVAYKRFAEWKEGFERDFDRTQFIHDNNISTPKLIIKFLWNKLMGVHQYDFFSKNCHNDCQDIYHDMGFTDHFTSMMRADSLDFRDVGVVYDLWSSCGLISLLWNNFEKLKQTFESHYPHRSWWLKKQDLKPVLKALEKDKETALQLANTQDANGNSALHKALLNKDISTALKLLDIDVDANLINRRAELPLHLAAALKPSADKQILLTKLIERTADIDQADLYAEFTPLSRAVLSNDYDAVKLLASHGANIHYVNREHNNMGILASKYHNPEAARALYELDPELLTFDDLSRQIPFHHEHVQDILGKDAQPSIQDIPPKKTFEELYLIIRDLDGFFAPLHHDMDSRDSL